MARVSYGPTVTQILVVGSQTYPLAIVRIFARWGIAMPSYKVLKAAVAGLSRAYLSYHGPYSLAPQRAEPMTFSMVRELYAIPVGDQHMAALTSEFSQLKAAAEIQAYEHALRAATDPFSPQKPPWGDRPAAPTATRVALLDAQLTPVEPNAISPPAEPLVTLEPIEETPKPGAELAVCRTMWPSYPCDELGGQGWRVLVLSATPAPLSRGHEWMKKPTTRTPRCAHAPKDKDHHRGRYRPVTEQSQRLAHPGYLPGKATGQLRPFDDRLQTPTTIHTGTRLCQAARRSLDSSTRQLGTARAQRRYSPELPSPQTNSHRRLC
jgi:hypothetical protein